MTTTNTDIPQPSIEPEKKGGRRFVSLLVLLALIVAAGIYAVPKVLFGLSHVSTDDAAVNGHVTYLSSRVGGVAENVLVDDNQYVKRGTTLVTLDPEPFQIVVQQRRASLAQAKLAVAQNVAALEVARADLEQVRNTARAQIAGLKAAWYMVATIQDLVRYQTASLRSSAAVLAQQQANLRLAQQEYNRVKTLDAKSVSQEEIDQRKAAVQVAEAQVAAASENIQQTRALLGLQADTTSPTTVPSDVTQTFSGTQYAVAAAQQSLAQLGLRPTLITPHTDDLRTQLLSLSVDTVVEQSPAVQASAARVKQALAALGGEAFDPTKADLQPGVVEAQKLLETAELDLRYTTVTAPLDGFVSRRNVSPGNHVQAGQPLMAIRPLQEIWVDANFKETQLADLRIGQAVDLHVDAYPGKVFKGRVAGFSPGTGSVNSLLPPENATGNFVKVVQRLPVRIELTEKNSTETPLFAGLSVIPEVDIKSGPTGPDAGQRLLGLNGPTTAPTAIAGDVPANASRGAR